MPREIFDAHTHSPHHRDEILNSKLCGRFDCLETFKPTEVTEWLVDGTCALCPRCGIDSVIGDKSGYPITKESLAKVNKYWFDGRVPGLK